MRISVDLIARAPGEPGMRWDTITDFLGQLTLIFMTNIKVTNMKNTAGKYARYAVGRYH